MKPQKTYNLSVLKTFRKLVKKIINEHRNKEALNCRDNKTLN